MSSNTPARQRDRVFSGPNRVPSASAMLQLRCHRVATQRRCARSDLHTTPPLATVHGRRTCTRPSRRRAVCQASETPSDGPGSDNSLDSMRTSTTTSGLQAAELVASDDTNLLQTALAAAIANEDFKLAAQIRDRLEQVMGGKAARIDWSALEMPFWLSDRLERLGYRFPTEVQRRAALVLLQGMDTAIQSETGSGKTLSFLAPVLGRMVYPPEVFVEDLKGPQAIIVVPTMELGVQVCLLAYRLFGGSVNHGQPGDTANMFTYVGPKSILVRGVLNKEEVVMAKETEYLAGTHLVVTTPSALVELYSGEDRKPVLDHLRMLVIDEFDECFQKNPEATMLLLSCANNNNVSGTKPQVVLVGATLSHDQVNLATSVGWIRDPVVIRVGRQGQVPSSLKHRFVVCDASRRLALLVRMLRQDLEKRGDGVRPARTIVFAGSPKDAAECVEPLRTALWNEHSISLLLPLGSPAPSPAPGSAASTQLRNNPEDPEVTATASHELAGSSPFSATDPIRALLSFRDNKTTLLLCTPAAARGLDLPAVRHVYSLGCPADAAQYLHRAGRAGRIGSTAGATVTTIVTPDEVPALTAIMAKLGLTPTQQDDEAAAPPLLEPGAQATLEVLGDGKEEGEAGGAKGGGGRGRPRDGPAEEGPRGHLQSDVDGLGQAYLRWGGA